MTWEINAAPRRTRPRAPSERPPPPARDRAGEVDSSHAQRQGEYHAKSSEPESPMLPAKTVEGTGDVDTQFTRFDQAVQAKSAAQVIQVVEDMSTERRRMVQDRLEELAGFMSARQIIHVGGLMEAMPGETILAALHASPKLSAHEARAYFADLGTWQLHIAMQDAAMLAELKAQFPSPLEILPQLGHSAALNPQVLEWLIATGNTRLVARVLLSLPARDVPWHAQWCDTLGERGWQWLAAVDSALAAITAPATLEAWRRYSDTKAKETVDQPDDGIDQAGHAEELGKRVAQAEAAAKRTAGQQKADAAALRARRASAIASSSVDQLQVAMQRAGLPPEEQLDWLLDKPGITAADLRAATLVMVTDQIPFSAKLTAKLQKRFPKVPVEELFSGDIPQHLADLGSIDTNLARWLLAGAQPETILRIVASSPANIDEWCDTLVTIGVGFGWVRGLGGHHNDHLLRRFVLKCTDAPTREFIDKRLLGEGMNPTKTTTVPKTAPEAYESSAKQLDRDLARRGSPQTSDDIAADLGELSAKQLGELRHDAARLKRMLASANQKTFPQLLDLLEPELQVVVNYATPATIRPAHLAAWMQTRRQREVVMTLSSELTVERLKGLVPGLGPLELLPQAASPEVLAPALKSNPALLEWLLDSEPSKVIRAFASPSVIDLAVRGLAGLEDITGTLERWPSAAALGTAGRSVLVQLAARAKGELKQVLDEKLAAKLPVQDPNADEQDEISAADADALALSSKTDFKTRLEELLRRDAPPPTILALCRAASGQWQQLTKDDVEALRTKLTLSPDVVFSVPLGALIGVPTLHGWILATAPALKVLRAIAPVHEATIAATLENDEVARRAFVDGMPRGRGLSPADKALLRRMSKHVGDRRAAQLFEIVFDTPVNGFSRAELDKLWSVLELVPHAHVDQKSISAYHARAGSADDGTAGVYWPETQRVDLTSGKLRAKDARQYDSYVAMSEAEAVEALGSKADVDRFVAEGRLIKNADGTYSFKFEDQLESFPHTILHEVGHAVDYMLGAQTELIYGLAGWKRFASDSFDEWARLLGGWDAVSEADKKDIRKVWLSWLNGGTKGTVRGMVDHEHALAAGRNANVGVVQVANFELDSFTRFNGQLVMASNSKQQFFTLSAKGFNASPSAYALSAPEEYFAECYANYYREYDGTPQTAAKKGASLAPWIKSWFDAHVDTIGHNPQRHRR